MQHQKGKTNKCVNVKQWSYGELCNKKKGDILSENIITTIHRMAVRGPLGKRDDVIG